MKFKLISIFFHLCLLGGCAANQQIDIIDLSQSTTASIFDIVDSIQILPLETNSESLIRMVSNVIPYNNRYYIFDEHLQALFCFDSQGKYLFKIANRGQGPEEYTYLGNVNIDPYNQQLLLLEPFGTLSCFDLDGWFISKTKLPAELRAYNEVHALNKDHLLFLSLYDDAYHYYSRTTNGLLKKRTTEYSVKYISFLDMVYRYNDSLYTLSLLENDVLNLSADSPKKAFVWDFGKENNTPEKLHAFVDHLNNLRQEEARSWQMWEGVLRDRRFLNYYIRHSHETSRYRIATIEYIDACLHVFIDKVTKQNFIFKQTTEDIKLHFGYVYNNSIISCDHGGLDPYYFAKSTLSPSQLKIVESHNPETDNPFLVVYHLKK